MKNLLSENLLRQRARARRPGTLANLGEALGKAGVNIEGIRGFAYEGKGVIHVLVEDAASARQALEEKGIEAKKESPVIVLDVVDKPGELGNICRNIADAGVNIDFARAQKLWFFA